jgi:hypothetical protein
MPFSFDVDGAARVLHVQAVGKVTDTELIDFMARLRREVAFVTGYPILCNCSLLTSVSISSNLIESLARSLKSRTNIVAVIAPNAAAFGLARMYQILSDPDEARIHVFARAEEAMAWLNASENLVLHA